MSPQERIMQLQHAGMTQQRIAAELRISQGAVSHILNGRTQEVRWTTMYAINSLYFRTVSIAKKRLKASERDLKEARSKLDALQALHA